MRIYLRINLFINSDIIALLSRIQLPTISRESFNDCESDVTEGNLSAALIMPKVYLTTKYPEVLRSLLGRDEKCLPYFPKRMKEVGSLSVSQIQAIIKYWRKNIETKGTLKIGDKSPYSMPTQK